MVLLWYFRVPLSGSRPRETRTSHVCGPREMSCPAFRAIRIPPAQKRAHRPHTRGTKIKNYWGFGRVLLIKESQRPLGYAPLTGTITLFGFRYAIRVSNSWPL